MTVIQPQDGGGFKVLDFSPFATATVPEPGMLWLLGAGVLGLFAWRRSREPRKRKGDVVN